MGELQIMFHRKVGNQRAKVTTIIQDIKGIFLLVEQDAFEGKDNFETNKIFKGAKVFTFEVCEKDCLKGFNLGEIVANNENIIYMN